MHTPQTPHTPLAPPTGKEAALHAAALALYRRRAARYDLELSAFEPIRRQAIERLALRPGETVLDLGCGTGLSLPHLSQAVGASGKVIGVEQCPEMLAQARARLDARPQASGGVELLCSPVQAAPLTGLADAAIFHFTHDILLSPHALAQVMAHLRPGARVVATGLQWAPSWAWVANAWVLSAAWYSISTLQGLEAPWRLLGAVLPGLRVEPVWQGTVFIAHGQVPELSLPPPAAEPTAAKPPARRRPRSASRPTPAPV